MDISIWWEIAFLVISLFLSAYFSTMETAAAYLSEVKTKQLFTKDDENNLSAWITQRNKVLNTIFLGNTLFNVINVFLIIDIEKQEYEKLKYLGYDKGNQALRYGRYTKGKKVYRVPLSTDYRIFVPVARDSKKFKTKYKKRTEVERLNGRLDRDYMFNDHFIRGAEKMELMVDLSFLVMLTMAKGHIKNKQKNIRSLVA